ncbi:MAG: HIT family protein [Promethearchaeota archaeon]
MEDCIFCKIIKGEIPSRTFYETDDVVGFLDINPVSRGHSLLMPKKHFKLIEQGDNETISNFFIALKEFSSYIKERLECAGLNILINQGKHAGQVIDHLHAHVIPRYVGDNISLPRTAPDISPDEIEKTFTVLK